MTKDQAPQLRTGLQGLITAVGGPSQTQLRVGAELAEYRISQQTFSETLKRGAFRLPTLDTVLAIVAGCRWYASTNDPDNYAKMHDAGQFDEVFWHRLHAEAQGKVIAEAWPRVRDVGPLNAGVKLSVVAAQSDSPIALWLEQRSPRTGTSSYVPRDHDVELRKRLGEAVAAGTGAVVLIGRSCTGKSRSAWEAARQLAPDWYFVNMRHPEEAERLRRGAPTEGGVVLWLDNLRAGTGVADAVNAALAVLRNHRRGYRAVAVASTWHAPAVLPADHPTAVADLFALNELAAWAGHPTTVKEPWSEEELERGWKTATDDGLLATALAQTEISPPQILAGSQWAISLWQSPPKRETRNLLTAAIDLAKFGFGVDPRMPLTLELLVGATPAYLERPPVSSSWFEEALAEATRPLEEAVWALRPPFPAGAVSYTLFDPLVEHGRLVRHHEPLPASVWQLFATADLTQHPLAVLAHAADHRLLHSLAAELGLAAAAAPPTPQVATPPNEPRSKPPAPPPPEPAPESAAAPRQPINLDLTSTDRSRANRLLADDSYDELVELAIVSNDTYVRRRLAMLYERHGEIAKMREVASFSNRGGRHFIEYLCKTGNLTDLLRMVAAGASHARRAIDHWPIKGLTEDDRRVILEQGLHPDGTPVGTISHPDNPPPESD